MMLGLVGSLVQARYIGPEDMGVFRTFGIIAGYLTFLHMGVFDGLQREIPLQLGRGNQGKAEQAASACLTWILFVSLVCGSVFIGLALRAACHREWMQFWGWLAYTPMIVSSFYGIYLGTTFRTGQQFVTLSKITVVQAVAGTLILPLMPFLGYYGACLRTAVNSIANVFLLHHWRPMRISPRLDWPSFRDVIRIGLPLSGAGYIATSLWISMEGTFVLHWFGIKILGLYSMAVFVRSVLSQLAQNLNQVMNVKIYGQYGRSGQVADCVRLILKPVAFAFMASLPLIIAGWLAMPWAVNLLIPKYGAAIPMMRVTLLALPISLLSLPTTILWATGRRFDCFASVILGFATFVVLCGLLHKMHVGNLSVLIASVLGQTINVLVSYMLILNLFLRQRKNLDVRNPIRANICSVR